MSRLHLAAATYELNSEHFSTRTQIAAYTDPLPGTDSQIAQGMYVSINPF